MTEEVWKDIKGYEGIYQISSNGIVRSLDRNIADGRAVKGTVLKQYQDKDGYLKVTLYGDHGRHFFVHRLVALAFIPNPLGYDQINHKDEVKTNNNASNLEWCNAKYNVNYGNRAKKYAEAYHGEQKYNSKLTEKDVLFMRKHYIPGDHRFGQSAFAKKYGVDRMTVKYAIIRRTWKFVKEEETA